MPSGIPRFNSEELKELEKLYLVDRISQCGIARMFSCSPKTVMDNLKKMGIHKRELKKSIGTNTRDKVLKMYVNGPYTQVKIAKKCKISKSAVSQICAGVKRKKLKRDNSKPRDVVEPRKVRCICPRCSQEYYIVSGVYTGREPWWRNHTHNEKQSCWSKNIPSGIKPAYQYHSINF